MTVLHLFLEGKTERNFVSQVLEPHLLLHGVVCRERIEIPSKNYAGVRRDILDGFAGHGKRGAHFTTMFDLYRLASAYGDFPGVAAGAGLQDPVLKAKFIESTFAADISYERFIPHVQLYEFETMILCRPGELEYLYDRNEAGVDRLVRAVELAGGPEFVNDSQPTSPSHRIIAEFPSYADYKATDGVELVRSIGLPAIRSQCPHFDAWVSHLEQLGRPQV